MPANTGRSNFSQCTRMVGGLRAGHRACSDLEIAEYQRLRFKPAEVSPLLPPDDLITPTSKFFAGWDNNRMPDHSSYHGIVHHSTLNTDSAFVSAEIHFWNGGR